MVERRDCPEEEVQVLVAHGFAPDAARRWAAVLFPEVGAERAAALKALRWSPTTIREYAKAARTRRDHWERYGDDRPGQYEVLDLDQAEMLIEHTERLGGPKVLAGWASEVRRQLGTDLADPHAQALVLGAERWIRRVKDELGVELRRGQWSIARMPAQQREAFIALANDPATLAGVEYGESSLQSLAATIGSPGNLAVLREHGYTLDRGIVANTTMPVMLVWEGFEAAAAPEDERRRWLRTVASVWYWKYSPEHSREAEDPGRMRLIDDPDIDPLALKAVLLAHEGFISPNALRGVLSEIAPAVADGFL